MQVDLRYTIDLPDMQLYPTVSLNGSMRYTIDLPDVFQVCDWMLSGTSSWVQVS